MVFTLILTSDMFPAVGCPGKGNQLPLCQRVKVSAGHGQRLLKEEI